MSRRFVAASVFAVVLAALGFVATPAAEAPLALCASVILAKLPDTTITVAEEVTGPSFRPPGATAVNDLPGFCRVVATTQPSVIFEVWMLLMNWNGEFQDVGNGGSAGVISYGAMANALRRGYATASTPIPAT